MTNHSNLGDSLRAGMRRLASGVCVISSADKEGVPHAMTATSVTSVSDSPASMLVCVNQDTSMHTAISSGERFCINVLAFDHEAISNRCASGDQGLSRFDVGNWQYLEQLPYLADGLVSFVCKLDKLVDYGTHTIVIGEIDQVLLNEDAAVDPLLYVDGGYRRLAD